MLRHVYQAVPLSAVSLPSPRQSVKGRDSGADAEQDVLGLFFSVVVVDARDNHPQPVGTPDAALLLARRGKRRIGRIAAARGLVDSKKKVRAVMPF